MLAQTTRPRTRVPDPDYGNPHPPQAARPGPASGVAGQAFLTMPFDAIRWQYAGAVMAGLAQRSIVASGKLEQALDALEKLILGPLARTR